ncbi:hypothetical protein [Nocardiopsis sp. NPDC058789]|uniref:hypothetical protein n=1 Tax=Nocardiopsis sp. NPDC058789 TaxID=3346634 RepID=UPI00367067F1
MSGFGRVRLDHRGVSEVMCSEPVRTAVTFASEQVGAAVRVSGRPVEVLVEPAASGSGIRDARPVGRVTVMSVDALPRELKHGHMARAAAALGLEVGEG